MSMTRPSQATRRPDRQGLTLVEAVMSMLIVAVMLTAALGTLGGAAGAMRIQATSDTAQDLARQLLAEALQADYQDHDQPGTWGLESGESGATRADFDDLDDYDGWSDSPPQTKDGAALSAFAGYRRSVAVANVSPADLVPSGPQDLGLRKIEVTVVDPSNQTVIVAALASKYGVCADQAGGGQTSVTWVGLEVQTARTNLPVCKSATLLNRPAAGGAP